MRGQSAAWTDRRIRPAVYERNIAVCQFVPLDVCHAFLARRSTSRRHRHYFAHIRVSTSTGSANSHLLAMLGLHLQNVSTGSASGFLGGYRDYSFEASGMRKRSIRALGKFILNHARVYASFDAFTSKIERLSYYV